MEKDNSKEIFEQDLHEHFAFNIDVGQEPLRIDKFLMNRIENATRNKIQKAAKEGSIRVNGIIVKSSYKVKKGDKIRILFTHPPYENLLTPENIELDINNTLISAPFSGIISDKMIEESEYITPGNVMFTIIDLNPIKIQGYLSEFDVNKVSLGTKAIIENTNGLKKNGVISFISPSAETSTRTFEITIEADNADLSFKSGITTKITIAGSELKAHKIPPSILTLQDDGTVGVKAVNEDNIVIFYPTTSVKDTIDGIWVSGLPDKVNLIVTGQEYVAIGESVSN